MPLDEKNIIDTNKIIEHLMEISITELLNYKFDKNLFKDDYSLHKLDKYLDLNFTRCIEMVNKEEIKILSQLIVKSFGLIQRYSDNYNESEYFKIKWNHLIKLCNYYLEAKSHISSYKAIEGNKNYIKVIKHLHEKGACIIKDLEEVLGNNYTKQNISKIIIKLETLKIITKRNLGQKVFVSLTSIGINIYSEYIQNEDREIEALEDKIIRFSPDFKLNKHKTIPRLSHSLA